MLKNNYFFKIKNLLIKKIRVVKNKIISSKVAFYYYLLIGVFDSFKTLSSDIEGAKRVLILGKGQSVKEINDQKLFDLIESSDYRILASSVDIENHKILKRFTYDVQFTSRVDSLDGFCPVYPKRIIKKFLTKGLCINSNRNYNNGLALARYKNFFNYPNILLFDTGVKEGFTPISDEPSLYGGVGLTMVQNILRQIMATKSVYEIVLIGVDFYGTGYLDEERKKNKEELKLFYSIKIGGDNIREKKGIPLIKYLVALNENNLFKKRFKLLFPKEIKHYIPEEILERISKQTSTKFI